MSGYERRLVEHLLPAVWDTEAAYGIRNPQAPDADMPKGTVDKRAVGALFAHLADIRRGWAAAPLSLVEKRALFMRFALDWDDRRIAAREAVTDRAVRYRLERGVGKLAAHLNGCDYIDGYEPQAEET
ncbi:hypothetical protein OG824_18525 [Streptomyces prunicolor]|uniref:hypothetical protein n=1 Tax=Streptomyces prunicolor TaxID=67348 RepID=UPI00225B69A4|nr:hypothetical protein [Streptomyces prunicolor]MCX5237197.1 hypothetical protein [Streptomyces prunicolor]